MKSPENGILATIVLAYLGWTPKFFLWSSTSMPRSSWEIELPILMLVALIASMAHFKLRRMQPVTAFVLALYLGVSALSYLLPKFVWAFCVYGLYCLGLLAAAGRFTHKDRSFLAGRLFIFSLGFYAYKMFILQTISMSYVMLFMQNTSASPVIEPLGTIFASGTSLVLRCWPMILLAIFFWARRSATNKPNNFAPSAPDAASRAGF